MGIFDEADRFYKNRSLSPSKETAAKVDKKKISEKKQEENIAPSSEYDGAFEILGIDVNLQKSEEVLKEPAKESTEESTKESTQTKKKKKLKVPIVNINPL